MKAMFRDAVIVCVLTITSTAHPQQSTVADTQSSGFAIGGIVSDSLGGQPLSKVTVQIEPVANMQSVTRVESDSDGRFIFPRVAAGKYSLVAGRRGYPLQGFNQHEAYATAIVAGPGLDTEHLAFRLHPEGSIRGQVIDEDENEPAQNTSVRLFARRTDNGRLATHMIAATTSDDTGYFSFAHLQEGTYYVAVSGRPWYASQVNRPRRQSTWMVGGGVDTSVEDAAEAELEAVNFDKVYSLTFYDGAASTAGATAIDLQPGQHATANFTLHAVPAVHLNIPRETPTGPSPVAIAGSLGGGSAGARAFAPPPRVQMFYSLFDDALVNADTTMTGGPDGFEITGIAPGHYVLQVISPQEGDSSGTYQELEIAGDMDLPTRSVPMAAVGGIVKFNDTPLPSNLIVTLVNSQLSRRYGLRVTGEGEFKFSEPVIPGKYEISVGGVPNWYIRSIAVTGARLSGRTLEISGSEPVRLALNVGHGLGRIDGTAVRDGRPVAGAMILLIPRDAENNSVLFRRDQSDSDGTFTLYNVVPGSYSLVAIEDGWHLLWSDSRVLERYLHLGQAIHISPSAKTQATVELQ